MKIFGRLKKDFRQIYNGLGFKIHSKTSIGIDFGREAIRCVRILESGGRIEISDVVIQSPPDLKKALEILKPAPDEEVYINFSDVDILIKRLSLPEMSAPELQNAIRWELKDQLSFKMDEALFDFKIIGKRRFPDGSEKLDILTIFAKESLIEEKLLAIKNLGLNVCGISSSSFALAKVGVEFALTEPVALIDIGLESSRLLIIENGALQFVREINFGGESITKAMTGVLSTEKGSFGLSRDEAEKLKIESGLLGEDSKFFSMVRPALERLTSQIKVSIEYYENQFGSAAINKLFLTGNGSRFKGLKEFLSKENLGAVLLLGLPTKFSFKVRQPMPSIIDEALPDISVALGLALERGFQNLLPKGWAIEKKKHIERFVFRISMALVIIYSIFSYLVSSVRLDSLRKVSTAYKEQWQNIAMLKNLNDNIAELRTTTKKIYFQELNPDGILKSLSFITPKEISLKQIFLDRRKKTMTLKGIILTPNQPAEAGLSEFMSALEASKFFEKVSLVSTEKSEEFKVGSSDFELICNLVLE